ncbi:extracellular solute-binding protein [Streptococcus pneumoniae]|nr:extracellular solute-binding protein [Streptococcus pneumoniae]
MGDSVEIKLILFENQIQTTSTSPCRIQVQPAASFLVCSLIFIEYKIQIYTNTFCKKVSFD